MMERPFATVSCALARKPVMLTSVPAGIESFFQPSRNSALGGPSSKCQFTTLPSASLTSTYSQAWGLTHSTFVTVPFTFTGLIDVKLGGEGVVRRERQQRQDSRSIAEMQELRIELPLS